MERQEWVAVLGEARELARRQHGVILGAQLRSLGLTSKRLARLVREGWLVPLRPRAYCVGVPPTDWRLAVAAALLAGPGTALSHGTAARVHRFAGVVAGPEIELTAGPGRQPRLGGVTVHRSPTLDVVDREGVAVTSPARTLIDVADRYAPALLGRIVDEGLLVGLWTVEGLAPAVEAAGRRAAVLAPVLAARQSCAGADSHLELRVQQALTCLGPFETRYLVQLGGRLVQFDIAWPRWRVAVECDGWAVRSRSRSKFDHDRRKGNVAAAHGWTVIHVTSAMSDAEMLEEVVKVLLPAVMRAVPVA